MDFSLLSEAFLNILAPSNLLLVLGGMLLGVFFGALPGISSSMGIVLMMPFTYYMGIIPSIILLVALYAGSAYGGSITAILFNTPGTPEAVATTFDGYPLAQKGKAGRALGLAVSSSAIGGIVAVLIMLVLAPPMSKVALEIQSAEYFALTVLGIVCIAGIGSKNIEKSLITGGLGILIAMMGLDPMTGVTRFTFGDVRLLNGIEFIPVMIGAFALAEVLNKLSESLETGFNTEGTKISLEALKLKDLLMHKIVLIKSALIGTV
ncbi:MAG: tripartite tricarboxylate transporter permease, partial [Bacillota bacterium]|nr:tripartite tricarboxylate transporter permease [Bacillota bacterium]